MISLLQTTEQEVTLAFYAQDVSEVILCPTLRPEPNQKSIVEGYLKLEQRWIPVVPLSRVLGFPDREVDLYDTLIISKDQHPWALRVGRVLGVSHCTWEQLEPVTGSTDGNPGLAAHLQSEDGLISVMVLPQVLLECERLQMQEQLKLLEVRKYNALGESMEGPT